MRKHRVLAGFMAAAMIAGALTGCGGDKKADASKEAPSEVAQATGEDVKLRVVLWDYSNVTYFKTIIEAFEAKYPNIKVEGV